MNLEQKAKLAAENMPKVYDSAYNKGLEKGIEQGKQTEYDRFWDAYQDNGNRTSYSYAFCSYGWDKETFKPKYPITPGNYCFYQMNLSQDGNLAVDFANVTLDGSLATTATYMFANSCCKNITIDLSNCHSLLYTFMLSGGGYMDNVSLKVSEKLTTPTNTFANNWTLQNLRFIEGSVIACNGFDFHWSTKLTKESIISVFNALKDYSGTNEHSITLGTTNLNKLTDSEKAIATQKGWSLA